MTHVPKVSTRTWPKSGWPYYRAKTNNPVILGSPRIIFDAGFERLFVDNHRKPVAIGSANIITPVDTLGLLHLVGDIQGYLAYTDA